MSLEIRMSKRRCPNNITATGYVYDGLPRICDQGPAGYVIGKCIAVEIIVVRNILIRNGR